jgi:hypothetical protein
MAVPYTFGTATASIPLSNLDSNFATTITLGNTAIQLGNTVTTLNNMTLANVTVSSGSVTLTNITATTANVTTANISGTTTLTNLTASTALALDASKNIVSVTNTGTGNNVLGTSPTIATPTISTITSAASTALTLQSNNGNTAVTVDTSQNVGIGTTSPSTYGSAQKILAVQGSSGSVAGYIASVSSDATRSIGLYSGLTSADNPSVIYTGELRFGSATSTNGVTGYSERMRIDSSGNVLVGTTSQIQGGKLSVAGVITSQNSGAGFSANQTNATGDQFYFRTNSGANLAGYITCPTSATTSYTSVSDYRLKENIVPMTGALEKIALLKPCTYTWKTDGTDGQGFIAHELQAVVPDCVVGTKDDVNEDGSIKPQAIDTSFLVATLTAAIQEQQALITALTARIVALEAK